MKVTLGGLSGTGKSSVGRELAKKLGYQYLSGGNFARQLAMDSEMTIEERDVYLFKNNITSDDEKIDTMQVEFGKENDNFILEAHLGWRNIPDSLKIKLTCQDDVRFKRTSKEDENRVATDLDDFEKTKVKSLEREEAHRARIEKTYGIVNLNDDNHFDIVIDTTNLTFEEVLERVESCIISHA
jgi:CMP/dCMP kinase